MNALIRALYVSAILIVCGVLAAPHGHAQNAAAYKLGVADKVHIIVFNEPDLTGDFDVNDQGILSLPLIGQVHVAGMTLSEAQDVITKKYGTYLISPRVNVAILVYRPVYVIGEVKHPGSYPYINGMTVLNAVAVAGGYTPRGDKNDIKVKHSDNSAGEEQHIGENDPVIPGDIIRVNQRFF